MHGSTSEAGIWRPSALTALAARQDAARQLIAPQMIDRGGLELGYPRVGEDASFRAKITQQVCPPSLFLSFEVQLSNAWDVNFMTEAVVSRVNSPLRPSFF